MRISAKWCGVLAALLLSAPLLSAAAVGEGNVSGSSQDGDPWETGASSPFSLSAPQGPRPQPRVRVPAPMPAPPPVMPLPTVQPTLAATEGFCADAVSTNVVDAELTGVAQAGIDLLTEYFGCQKFRIDGTGLPIKFGEITPMLNAKVPGYAHSTPDAYEIWLNRDCWGVVGTWAGVVAHELGHYLGWRHGDDHPYMWLPPPPGSYARASDAMIVCY